MIPFVLDTIEMNSGRYDANNAIWYVEETDWFDAPAYRQSIIDLDLDHGSIVARSNLDRRTVHFAGVCKAKSEAAVWKSRARLLAALTTFTAPKIVKATEYGTTKQSSYWATSGTQITMIPGGFRFDISILCEDPRRYAVLATSIPSVSSGANTVIFPQGSFPSEPTILVSNIPFGAVNTNVITITNSFGGSSLGTFRLDSFESPVGETDVTINVSARTVVGATGVNRFSAINTGSAVWPVLQPGGPNTLSFTGTTYAMNGSFKDVWL